MASISPTFYGHIASTYDALLLFDACHNGSLNHIARRPYDRERLLLIKSGNVFIYSENISGFKRWTDGVPWSPSRFLGNFLVYQELIRPFTPSMKRTALKKDERSLGISQQKEEVERSDFKKNGLVKKSISVIIGDISHTLVSYYTLADIQSNNFPTPSKDSRFQSTKVCSALLTEQNFRAPIDGADTVDHQPVYANEFETMGQRTLPLIPISRSSVYGGPIKRKLSDSGSVFNVKIAATKRNERPAKKQQQEQDVSPLEMRIRSVCLSSNNNPAAPLIDRLSDVNTLVLQTSQTYNSIQTSSMPVQSEDLSLQLSNQISQYHTSYTPQPVGYHHSPYPPPQLFSQAESPRHITSPQYNANTTLATGSTSQRPPSLHIPTPARSQISETKKANNLKQGGHSKAYTPDTLFRMLIARRRPNLVGCRK